MNKDILLMVGAVLLLAAGAFYFGMNPPQNMPIPGTPPAPPQTSQGEAPIVSVDTSATTTNSTAVVNGTVDPNGANTEFWYEYGDSTSLGLRTPAYSIGSGNVAIRAPGYIENLKATTTYHYRLVAKNVHGTVRSDVYNFNTTNVPPRAPGRSPSASTTEATNVERTIARINGQVNPSGWATTFWFEYGQTTDLGLVTAFESAGEGTSSKSVGATLYNLSPLTKYYFRINAQNQYGTVNGDIFSFTTTGPLTPSKPTVYTDNASGISMNSATLRGRVNPNAASTIYWFEYGTDNSLGNIIATVTSKEKAGDGAAIIQVSMKVNNLSRDTNYFYRLVADNSFGIARGDIEYFTTNK